MTVIPSPQQMVVIRCEDVVSETGFSMLPAYRVDSSTALHINNGVLEILPIKQAEQRDYLEIDWTQSCAYREFPIQNAVDPVIYHDATTLSFVEFIRKHGVIRKEVE